MEEKITLNVPITPTPAPSEPVPLAPSIPIPPVPTPPPPPPPSSTLPPKKKVVGLILGIGGTALVLGSLIGFLSYKGLLLPKTTPEPSTPSTPAEEEVSPIPPIPPETETLTDPALLLSPDQLEQELGEIEADLRNLDQIDEELNEPEVDLEL